MQHYIPSVIAAAQLGHETDCVGQLTNVIWDTAEDAHPKSYEPEEIKPDL